MEVLVAMPEQRARMLRATRSPSRILRIGPVTVAQWVIGTMGVVSVMCHVTLISLVWGVFGDWRGGEGEGDVRASKLGKDFVKEGDACEDALVVTYCVSMHISSFL